MFRVRYAKTIASCAALAVLALLFTLVLTHTGPAKPRPAPHPQIDILPLTVGNYATAINVHNPSLTGNPVTLYKRAVIAVSEPAAAATPYPFVTYSLPAGSAVEIDCTDITTTLITDTPSGFVKGFVTILAVAPLDVVGVYTAEPEPFTIESVNIVPGISLEMLNIVPHIESVPGGAGLAPTGRRFYEYSAKFLCGNNAPVP
jgi:hypothetical protein